MHLSWMKPKFQYRGNFYPLKRCFFWLEFIPVIDKPINYLEIGVLQGINTIDILKSYCAHPDSRIYCIDPWEDYNEYDEYKGKQNQHYNDFLFNVQLSGKNEKYVVKRGYSEDIVPTLENNFFDLVFIDGNHETEYVYKDGVMCLEKTKVGGYIVFDDYDWVQTKAGIHKFLEDYKDRIEIIGHNIHQFFIRKTN